jgi:lipopolysaccharide transport system ATP-binding protein
MQPVVHAEGLGKRYRLGDSMGGYGRLTEDVGNAFRRLVGRTPTHQRDVREIWALKDISLELNEGDIVGVVGRNGAGKSTLLKVLARITEPTEGRAVIRGRVGSLLEVGTGFHPELTGRENVFLNGAILGMRGAEIRAKFDDIVGFAEVEQFIDTPVKRYSSGMYVRLAFAVAAFLEPEILFIDEVLSVGDQAFQQRCLGRMGEIAHSGRTILFVSHNLASVSALCSRALLIESGRLLMDGDVDEVIERYVSSVQVQAGERLGHREDREGEGPLRIESIRIEGSMGGALRSGEPCTIALNYTGAPPQASVMASFAVEGPLSEPMFVCSSEVSGDDLVADGSTGELVCSIPSLPLLSGRYSLYLYVRVNGTVSDKVRNAIYFDVFESDVFGTGRLPSTAHGRFLVPHTWSTGDRGAAELPSRS